MTLHEFLVRHVDSNQKIDVFVNSDDYSYLVIKKEKCRDVVHNDEYKTFLESTVIKYNALREELVLNIYIDLEE